MEQWTLIWNNEQRVSIPSSFIDSDQESTFESINLRPNVEYFLNRKITIKFKKMYIWASEYYSLRYVFRDDGGLKKRHNIWLASCQKRKKEKKMIKICSQSKELRNMKTMPGFFLEKNLLPKQGRNMKTMPVFFWWWNNIQIKAMEKVADFFYHSRSCSVEGETQNSHIS